MKKIIVAIMTMFVGGIIYVLWRSDSLVMFTWFDALGMRSQVLALRGYLEPYSITIPRWLYFSLPQALWLFSGMVAFNCIWGKYNLLNNQLWSLAFCSTAFGFEFGQYIGLVPGHFDIFDISLLILALITALLINYFDNNREKMVQMKIGTVVKHFASFLLFVVFIVLALGSTDSGSNRESRAPSTPTVSRGEERRISGDHWFGCTDRKYFDKLVEYAVQKDDEAFRKALASGLLVGTCTIFKNGEVVYITDTAIFSGLVKVRRKGEIQEYWTKIEAVK